MNQKVAPFSTSPSAHTAPPWRWTMRWTVEPDPRAFELVRGVQALEGAEEVLGVAHVEAGPVVAHEERHAATVPVRPELDERGLVMG